MYYVYVLQSQKNKDLYIGKCADLKVRFKRHNDGYVRSTQSYRPWKLVYYEAYLTKTDADIREIQLKKHAAKINLKSQIKNSLEDGLVAK